MAKPEKIIKQLTVGFVLLFSFAFSLADLFHSLYQRAMKAHPCAQHERGQTAVALYEGWLALQLNGQLPSSLRNRKFSVEKERGIERPSSKIGHFPEKPHQSWLPGKSC